MYVDIWAIVVLTLKQLAQLNSICMKD